MNAQIEKEAGLYTQIRTLRKRIDSLDMGKVNPTELKSAIDSLHDLETRYADMQEKKKQRSIEKQNREKELASQTVVSEEVRPESVPVEAAPGGMLSAIPLPLETPAVETPAAAAVDAPIVTAEVEPATPEKKADEPKPEEKLETMDLSKDPEFDSMMASALYMKMLDYLIMADDPQHETIMKFRKAIERIQNEEDREKLKACFNKEFAVSQQTPWDYYAQAKKETEIKPEAVAEKTADTSKFALDDVVEPIYGTSGSMGRVMRYDADKDMAYVHWDSGKLATDHGFGAYKGSDLRKRAAQEVTDKVRCNNCYGIYDEDIKVCPKCKTDEYLMQPFMHNDKKAESTREISYEKCTCGHMKFDHEVDEGKTKCDECACTGFSKKAFLKKNARVVHQKDGWHVLSEEGKNLGGPYDSKDKAVERLRQVEYFKHHKGSENLGLTADEHEEFMRELVHQKQELAKDPKGKHEQIEKFKEQLHPGYKAEPYKEAEGDGMGYGGDRPGIAVAPKRDEDVSLNSAEHKESAKLNVANRMWEIIPKYDLVGDQTKLVGYDIMSDTGERAGFIKTDKPLNPRVIEQEIWNKLNGSGMVNATLNTNLSVLKKGHKVKIVSVDLARKEAKFASLEMKSVSGWTALDKFEFVIEANNHAVEADLMPMSKTDNVVRVKSFKVLTELAEKCPDCYKKFLKFAKEKGLVVRADDLSDHVEQVRTKINQTKEVLQTQTQAAETAPETVETEAALPPKPNVTLPQGMKWMYNIDTNTWDMVTDSQFTY